MPQLRKYTRKLGQNKSQQWHAFWEGGGIRIRSPISSSGMALPKPKLSCPIFPTRQQPQRSQKVALHFAADDHLTKDSTKKPFPKFHPTQHGCF
ncbi:unnamed protein product, partial [Vitis vinifera]|uniref:Uncharacterized protein n=1 Tax=Vitis vinifera TaxID=29760 RepID=D7SVG5_VITVI